MDRRTDWPWSWEEEAEWKAELEERDYDFIEELIDEAVSNVTTGTVRTMGPGQEEGSEEDAFPERYLAAA